MSPKSAFVTGATGFVGLNLVRELVEQGWRVTAMHRASSDVSVLSRFPADRAVGDVTRFDTVRAAMPERVDAVFHVAGNTSLWGKASAEQDAVNIDGTRNVVRVALEKGAARFVHTSSIVAYGLHGGLITEETPTGGASARINYVRSKALAEREVRQGIAKGLKAVIVNPSNIIGCYDTQNWSRMFLLVAEKRLPGVPPGGGSFCHARAVARAHIVAAEKGRIGANYLLGGAEASYRRLVQQMAEIVGYRARFVALPPRLLALYAHAEEWLAAIFGREPDVTADAVTLLSRNIYCSSKRAVQELDYRPEPLEAMLRDCYEWLCSAGLLKAAA